MKRTETQPGESIKMPPGLTLKGQGKSQGLPQFVYHNDKTKMWYRITRKRDGGWIVEEWTSAELGELGCSVGCDD